MYSTVLKFTILMFLSFLRETECFLSQKRSCHHVISYHLAEWDNTDCFHNPDILADVPQVCQNHGYNLETFSLTTSDGYLLSVFRVTSSSINITRPPVFIQYGVTITSGSWFNTNDRSIVFYLVNLGYEVYVGNFRGGPYSNRHVSLTIEHPEYWNFTIDTLMEIDVRTQLKFVANKTNQKIIYLGHSMGTTLSFMYASQYYEEARNLLLKVVAWCPVAYFEGTIVETLAPVLIPELDLLIDLQITGLLYQEAFIHGLFTTCCRILPEICYTLMSTLSGPTHQFPPEDLLILTSYWPSGTSVRVLKHFMQIAVSKRFQKYDYGQQGNRAKYGASEPPVYDLSKIQVDMSVMYGDNDVLVGPENIERLFDEIGSTNKKKFSIPINGGREEKYAHIDFINSVNIIQHLYEPTVSEINFTQNGK